LDYKFTLDLEIELHGRGVGTEHAESVQETVPRRGIPEGSRQTAVLDSGHDTRNLERYADMLARDPRYAKHSDAEILKAAYRQLVTRR
jgi:hypothetical protein